MRALKSSSFVKAGEKVLDSIASPAMAIRGFTSLVLQEYMSSKEIQLRIVFFILISVLSNRLLVQFPSNIIKQI